MTSTPILDFTESIPGIQTQFSGTWLLDPSRSTAIDPWRNLSLEIDVNERLVTLQRRWRGSSEGGAFNDSLTVELGGEETHVSLEQWPDNRHLGAYIGGDGTKTLKAMSEDDGATLVTKAHLVASVQQGETFIRIYSEYRLAPDGNRIDLIELRSTRPTPVHYVFRRDEASQ